MIYFFVKKVYNVLERVKKEQVYGKETLLYYDGNRLHVG